MEFREIYQKVREHLLTQNAQATCRYLTKDGLLKCAIGCLIPNELYSEEIEGTAVADIISPFATSRTQAQKLKEVLELAIGDLDFEKFELLKQLQFIHDYYQPVFWTEQLDACAHRNNL